MASDNRWLTRFPAVLSGCLGLCCAGSLAVGRMDWVGPTLSGCLLCLALAVLGIPRLKQQVFTVWILAAVAAAMTWPDWFARIGDFETNRLIIPVLQVIMFGMGTTMSIGDFLGVVRMPGGVVIGVIGQLTIMPLLGYGLAVSFKFPPEIAAGIVLVGCSPSGLASNVMCYLARANVALSITLTTVITLLSPFTTPLLMKLLASQMIPVDAWAMMWSIVQMTILPVVGGIVFHHTLSHHMRWLERAMPGISMTGILVATLIIISAGRDALLNVGMTLMLVCFLHCGLGYLLGYFLARVLGCDIQTCRTVSFEVGMQNSGLATGIAASMNKIGTLGLAPVVFGPIMNVAGSILASWWRAQPVDERPATTPQAAMTQPHGSVNVLNPRDGSESAGTTA